MLNLWKNLAEKYFVIPERGISKGTCEGFYLDGTLIKEQSITEQYILKPKFLDYVQEWQRLQKIVIRYLSNADICEKNVNS